MVKIQDEKIIIEIEHPFPNDFIDDLKDSIVSAVQNQELNELTDFIRFQDTNYTLLELLKNINE